jgi:serine O-acetyltransferase
MTAIQGSSSISHTEPDWNREKRIPGRYEPAKHLLSTIRRYQELRNNGGFAGRIIRPFVVLQYRFWSAVTGADIPLDSNIEGGLLLPHPNGIVIHPHARIGPNCLFFQQVTIGMGGRKPGAPDIGGHVDIGAGAKILGGVTIGPHALIGANAVVLDDVPTYATAVGVPARIIRPEHAQTVPETT